MNLQLFGNGGTREQELRNAMLAALTETTNQLASTLYTHTWKTRTTPDGNQIISLRASQAKRAAGFSPWEKTPQASDGEGGVMEIQEGSAGKYKLRDFAAMASWATPSSRDWKDSAGMATTGTNPDGTERERLDQLPRQANLAAWPTPQAFDASNDGEGRALRYKGNAPSEAGNTRNPETPGSYRGDLKDYATLASWPTPNAMEGGQTSRSGERRDEMLMGGMVKPSPEGPARLTASGVMLTGSDAGMDGGGQLNQALPRWLQAIPAEWGQAALEAHQKLKANKGRASTRTKQRRSQKA